MKMTKWSLIVGLGVLAYVIRPAAVSAELICFLGPDNRTYCANVDPANLPPLPPPPPPDPVESPSEF